MPQLWALIVTIETYASFEYSQVPGAHKDGNDTVKYLKTDLGVPQSHIVHLKDRQASRNGIISMFQSHLIDNPNIAKGDAILFHYSGHGSFATAPSGWVVIDEKTEDDSRDSRIEVIIPYDEGSKDIKTGHRIRSIPDRTIAALVNKIAIAHGNNITVVLDCCNSGHGTRGDVKDSSSNDDDQLFVRAIDPDLLSPLFDDLDDEIVARSLPIKPMTRRGRIKALAADHVLMAACGPREEALGSKRRGGIFTGLWLQMLQDRSMHPRTYAEIINKIEAKINDMSKEERLKALRNQHPQCDGIVRDRLVFEEVMMRGDYFDAAPVTDGADTDNMLKIEAGQIQSIEPNTLFEIHVMDKHLQSERIVGTAIAREVDATTCIAELPNDIVLTQPKYTALVAQPPEKLIYEVQNGAPDSIKAQESLRLFRESMDRMSPKHEASIREATGNTSADLRVSFNEDGSLTLYRLDPLVGALRNVPPKLISEEVRRAEFGEILYGIARFNRLLAWSSRTHPVADHIKFDLHPLVRRDDDEGFIIGELGAVIDIIDDEMTIEQAEDEDNEYALVLSNETSQRLHAEVWYFDPSTYKITACYKSANPKDATLPGNGGKLQIGASTERAEPLEFYVPEGTTSDTIFLKAFITDRPTKLKFLEQPELIGEDAEGGKVLLQKGYNRAGEGEIVAKGMWDTILRKVTIVTPAEH
jgi:hypothetical protein